MVIEVVDLPVAQALRASQPERIGDYGLVAAVAARQAGYIDDDDDILLINSDGIIIRMAAKEISKLGRATQGVKIMNVGEDANIIALAKVIKEDELDGESGEKKQAAAKEKESGEDQEQMKL